MGVRELRDAFNEAAAPEAVCQRAFLDYVSEGTMQWQIFTFSGNYANGTGFSIKSNRVRPGGDILLEARTTAQTLLKQRGST